MLNKEKILNALEYALPVTLFDVTDSTNLRLKEMCRSGDKRLQLLCADHQTAGRGRLGRSFLSPEKTGVYMSLLLPLPKDDLPLTIRAAVAVCRAVEEVTGKHLLIKWVNDLFLNRKKVCGILAEGVEDMAVLGIGLNVKMPRGGFPGVPVAGALDRKIKFCTNLVGVYCSFSIAKCTSHDNHYCNHNLATRVVADSQRFTLLVETFFVLECEREFGAKQ